jgi:hypothetical protein
LLALLGASATAGSIAAATATAAPGAVIASPRLLDLKRQLDAALVQFEEADRRHDAAYALYREALRPSEHLRDTDWEAYLDARDEAIAATNYDHFDAEFQGALDTADELVRAILAEPVASTADLAIKLSAALPIMARHEMLDDDMAEQLGWMERMSARLVTDACKLVGVPTTGLVGA